MVLNHDRWRDGDPYDLDALDELTDSEKSAVEADLMAKSHLDWRDVEALARLGTPAALERVAQAAREQSDHGGAAAMKIVSGAGWSTEAEARFIAQLNDARLMETSLDRLFDIARVHPTPAVRAALFRLATEGEETVRYAFGAFLLYLAGQANEWYGLNQDFRPHLHKLKGDTPEERTEAAAWLKSMIERGSKDT